MLHMKYQASGEKNKNRKDRYENPERIEMLLEKLMFDLGGHRAWIISFKSDGKLGYSAWGTWQADFEVVRPPLEKLGHMYQDLPVSIMREEFDRVEKYGFSCIQNVEHFYNGYEGHLHASRGLKAYYGIGIKKAGQLVGGLGVDWYEPHNFIDSEIEMMKELGKQISHLMKDKLCKTCIEWFIPETDEHVCKECERIADA